MFKVAAFVVVLVVFVEAAPKCGKFEKFVQQSTPEGTCASPKQKPSPKGPPKCQCVAGCVRYKKQCIPVQQCPVATTVTQSTTASTSQASSTVPSTSASTSSASPSTTVAPTSASPVMSTVSIAATSTEVPSTVQTSTSASPSTTVSLSSSAAPSSASASSSVLSSTTFAAAATTQQPAGAKCLKYLTDVCKNASPKESAKCKTTCKKQVFSSGNCAKLVPSVSFGDVLCVCK